MGADDLDPGDSLVVFLHGLGCSAQTWRYVISELSGRCNCLALDLPGHGKQTGSDALTVEQMAEAVIDELSVRRPRRWSLVGHSMGGKVATIVTAALEAGRPGLAPPAALVLVASSPLGIEPMEESTRAQMIGWRAVGEMSKEDAAQFVDANTASELPAADLDEAVGDVRRVSRTAWLGWLERGSLEDWSDTTGPIGTPTLVVAGAEDGDLGADAQRRLVLPAVAATGVSIVPRAAHLIMLEQPTALADLIATHVGKARLSADLAPELLRLLDSDRVSARTRGALLERLKAPVDGQLFTDGQRETLTALLASVLPQRTTDVDLAGRIEADLAARLGDGWRFADLPDDVGAWRAGLDTLIARDGGFAVLSDAGRDAVLHDVADGQVGFSQAGLLTPERMVLWFEDVRATAARAWISHPEVMAHIGYDGFANGGDGVRKQGYLRVGADELEPWQTLPLLAVRAHTEQEGEA